MKQGNNITLKKHLLFVLLSLWLVSCYNDNPVIVVPISEQEESPSAKDNQPWPLTQYMDAANYRPGDDFFMFCNGSYWSKYGLDYYTLVRQDVHAFPSARVNGVMMNIDRWYELYNVKEGDKLYLKPESRIHIW